MGEGFQKAAAEVITEVDADRLLTWCFLYFANYDRSNAAVHQSVVRYSPITFRLAEAIDVGDFINDGCDAVDQELLLDVLADRGRYPEDRGRIDADPGKQVADVADPGPVYADAHTPEAGCAIVGHAYGPDGICVHCDMPEPEEPTGE